MIKFSPETVKFIEFKDYRHRKHIIKCGKGWALKVVEGNKIADKIYLDRNEAIKDAQDDRIKGYDIVIHRADGSVEKWQKAKKVNGKTIIN